MLDVCHEQPDEMGGVSVWGVGASGSAITAAGLVWKYALLLLRSLTLAIRCGVECLASHLCQDHPPRRLAYPWRTH